MENDTDVYLVAGATGRTGVHITKELLAKGKKVRILIRNIDRAWGYFKEKMSEFESVVICDILSNDYAKSLEEAFAPKNGNQVKYVISTLSYRFEKTISCEDGNYTTNKRLIDIAKTKNIKKFVLLSSTHVRRPYSYITLTININKNNMQWWKVMAEKCLRDSGMNYLIIRPVGLIIDKEKEYTKSAFTLSQGDTVEGKIYRSTVGSLVVDTLLDENIPNNTSYECLTHENQFNKPYLYEKGSIVLKAESEEEKKVVDHIWPKRIVLTLGYSLIILANVGLYFLLTKLKKNKVWVR